MLVKYTHALAVFGSITVVHAALIARDDGVHQLKRDKNPFQQQYDLCQAACKAPADCKAIANQSPAGTVVETQQNCGQQNPGLAASPTPNPPPSQPSQTSEQPANSGTGGIGSVPAWLYEPQTGGSLSMQQTYATGDSACGLKLPNLDGVAVSKDMWEVVCPGIGDPNQCAICGQQVTFTLDGVSHTAKIVDKCMGCPMNKIDLTNLFGEKIMGKNAEDPKVDYDALQFGIKTGINWHLGP